MFICIVSHGHGHGHGNGHGHDHGLFIWMIKINDGPASNFVQDDHGCLQLEPPGITPHRFGALLHGKCTSPNTFTG
jgi:hypothetical protein